MRSAPLSMSVIRQRSARCTPWLAAIAAALVGAVNVASALTPNIRWRGRLMLDLEPKGGILDDQLVRLEDVGFVLEAGRSVAPGASIELGRDSVERGERVALTCRRLGVVPHEGAPDRDPA